MQTKPFKLSFLSVLKYFNKISPKKRWEGLGFRFLLKLVGLSPRPAYTSRLTSMSCMTYKRRGRKLKPVKNRKWKRAQQKLLPSSFNSYTASSYRFPTLCYIAPIFSFVPLNSPPRARLLFISFRVWRNDLKTNDERIDSLKDWEIS